MIRRRFASSFVLPLLVVSGPASAADVDCTDPADQMTMNICADHDLKASDKMLNAAYQALLKKLSPEGRQKLKLAQNAWIAYRDAQCEFDTFGSRNGSIFPMIHSACLDTLTQAQTKVLNQQLECQEGDVSCGNQ